MNFSRERCLFRNNCTWIVDEESLREVLVCEGADLFVSSRQDRRTMPRVVSVAGYDVNRVALKKPLCHSLRTTSPVARKRTGRNLDQAAVVDEIQHRVGSIQQYRVALGMGHDRHYAAADKAKDALPDRGHKTEVVELDQQVIRVCDGIAPWMEKGILDVVIGKVKVATQAELQGIAAGSPQPLQHGFVAWSVVTVLVIRVWSGHNIANTVLHSHPAHLGRQLPGSGAIVDQRQDVAVKINHSERLLAWVIVSFKTAFVAGLPIVVDYGVFLLLGIGIRSLRRYLFEASLGISSSKRTLLMGTTEGLASALRQISFHSEIHVVCLLSPDKKLRGARLAGFTVFDGPEELPTYLAAESDRDVGTSSGAGHKNPLCQHASGRETARRIVERFRRGESDKLPKRVADRALTATG